ncbi:MAG TPA: putative lipid II flippase FtsW [bacterium]|nr:putative lipid II flippase FtsW [bacterium]
MDRIHRRAPDYLLLFAVIALVGIGVVMVYSASSIVAADLVGDSAFFFKRQAMWAGAGFAALLVVQRLHYEKLRRITPVLLLIALAALLLVLVPGIGRVAGGARRWISLGGPLAFQPAEAAKLALILYLANFLANRGADVTQLRRGVVPPLVVTGVMFVLILAQPDMGTAVLIAVCTMGVLFVGGARISHLTGVALAGVPLFAVAVLGEDYRRQRILAFLNPWADPRGSGFHIIQSLLALGSGGLFGTGLGNSRQKFFYLPERHTDFIFSIVGEELGLIGTLAILILLAFVAYRGFQVARRAPDRYAALLAGGITGMIVLQAIMNIGVTTGVLPITGVPLPFLSFGGSSLLVTMIGVGIVLNISQYAGQGGHS